MKPFLKQPRVGYKRRRYNTAVIQEIEKKLEAECKRYNVSKAFVIANALAFVFNIEVEPYITVDIKSPKRAKMRSKVK